MRQHLSIDRGLSPAVYPLAAAPLLFIPHALVALAYHRHGASLFTDAEFWLLPLRRLTELGALPAYETGLIFLLCLISTWGLAILSFRRAVSSGFGYWLAALTVIPGLQFLPVVILAVLPNWHEPDPTVDESVDQSGAAGFNSAHVLQGVLAGVAIIIAAVLVSAVTFGAYGWGLFVLTPFTVGLATAYLANRQVPVGGGRTIVLVLAAAALGCVALIMMALEGLACLVLAAPLGAVAAIAGGALGMTLADVGHRRGKPLLSVAFLPAVFMLEAAVPPAASITSQDSIVIAAPPAAVWRALTSDAPVGEPAGLVGRAGLAYALGGRIVAPGQGGERLGYFSTGHARERITDWAVGRRLAFSVTRQPPAMEEMSPYRRVHAPHVNGYFSTETTRFDLDPIGDGRTRLTISTAHVLRIDPVPYWEPLARWAIHQNSQRVLRDIGRKAEQAG
ncbi:SRPBCC family protein [Sphingosinicella sp. LHD-64]|uniref:SRPBCC family protein n=1 Tax=Sphingosinicella sp. LHD-64 TaxID=3072139 RepID=UPI00280F4A77|nr:SRPBCC family protein [Sphingosinicella sp. LHD-64]MDQ8754711.1 SRPBCC family protein [Sphingosinicella sp. LHD-64]